MLFYCRTAFLACSVQVTSGRFGLSEFPTDDLTSEAMKKQMTDQEWDKVDFFYFICTYGVFFIL